MGDHDALGTITSAVRLDAYRDALGVGNLTTFLDAYREVLVGHFAGDGAAVQGHEIVAFFHAVDARSALAVDLQHLQPRAVEPVDDLTPRQKLMTVDDSQRSADLSPGVLGWVGGVGWGGMGGWAGDKRTQKHTVALTCTPRKSAA